MTIHQKTTLKYEIFDRNSVYFYNSEPLISIGQRLFNCSFNWAVIAEMLFWSDR